MGGRFVRTGTVFPRGEVALAIDIGGTKTAVALVARDGRRGPVTSAPTPGSEGPDAILDVVADLSRRTMDACPDATVRAIGVGTAGVVDVERGEIISSTDTLAEWAGTGVRGAVRNALASRVGDVAVHVQNDVDAFAIGETRFGAARGYESALIIAVGTGIGAAVVLDGRVRYGAHHIAGEIAHAPIGGADHLRCPCGRNGHLEAIGSGAGILRHYRSLGGDIDVVDGRAVADRAVAGETLARQAVTDSGAAVGRGIAAAVTLIDPSCVVVSGSVAASDSLWWQAMDTSLRAQLVDVLRAVPVRPGELGSDAPLCGAAASAWEKADQSEERS